MDLQPSRREHNMARWTFAGSVGVVGGSLVLGAAVSLGLDWRGLFAAFGVLTVVVLVFARRVPFEDHTKRAEDQGALTLKLFAQGLKQALHALRRGEVWRWLILLEASDLLLDVFLGFLALYMVDVARASEQASGHRSRDVDGCRVGRRPPVDPSAGVRARDTLSPSECPGGAGAIPGFSAGA